MLRIEPVPESEAVDRVEQTYGRIKETMGVDAIPLPFQLYARSPAFLQDFYMNFRRFVYSDGKLDAKSKALIALAVCALQRSRLWGEFLIERCRQLGVDDQSMTDAVAVAATCAMYNVFFKFRDLSGSDVFGGMSVGLRAHTFGGTVLPPETVELINIAVSDINGCKPCTSGHVEQARQHGINDETILEAIQCAATMSAGNAFLAAAGT